MTRSHLDWRRDLRRGPALLAVGLAALVLPAGAGAQAPSAGGSERRVSAEAADPGAYTRYELLAPGSGKFRITYDVAADRPGATRFYNPIRKGSVATDESVIDLETGAPLPFHVVSGAQARAEGEPGADPAMDYIRVDLGRPVPRPGARRIRILKTYEDPRSYRVEGEAIVFDRGLGIRRNVVVLPSGYRLTSAAYPVQVGLEPDGRQWASFVNVTPAEAPLRLRAEPAHAPAGPLARKIADRAEQSRDIVYFLKDPSSHAFELFHDYTETRAGTSEYVNVVRSGSQVSGPSAVDLDTGAPIPARILKGAEITAAGVSEAETGPVTADSEVVVFSFPAVPPGGSLRLRMRETYADPVGYRLEGGDLVFERTFGRAANAVVLPRGWELLGSLSPAQISRTDDGRERLDFDNPRPDETHVVIEARRAAGEGPAGAQSGSR